MDSTVAVLEARLRRVRVTDLREVDSRDSVSASRYLTPDNADEMLPALCGNENCDEGTGLRCMRCVYVFLGM